MPIKEEKKKVDGGKNHLRSRPYYFRRCKYKGLISTTNIDSLPDEMLFRILLELEPEEIYESAMLVCRRWYKIIRTHNFVQEHLEHSSPGLLIQSGRTSEYPTFVKLGGGGKIDKFKLKSNNRPNLRPNCWATCNGLALKEYPSSTNSHNLFIVNHTTNKRIALPSFSAQNCFHCHSCIGYAPASKEYKVVKSYYEYKKPIEHGCAVLTLGVDKSWRYIDIKHISVAAKELIETRPLITEGFVHWDSWSSLLSLNLETETITETHIPEECFADKLHYYFYSTWRSLTLLSASHSGFSWDVWEMMKKPGTWKKVLKIDLVDQRLDRLQQHLGCEPLIARPVGWLNYMEVLVLTVWGLGNKVCVLYNVGTREITYLELDCVTEFPIFCLHRNSLVWLDHT